MLLNEANTRLTEQNKVNVEELDALHLPYVLLDFHKDDFCKLVNAIGKEKWLECTRRWERLSRAEEEYRAKERFLKALERRGQIQGELEELEEIIMSYKPI